MRDVELPPMSTAVVVKLVSLAVHADELIGDIYARNGRGMEADIAAIRSLLSDHEVLALRLALDRQGLLPVKR